MKKHIIKALAVLALIAAATACSKYEKVAGDPMDSRIYTLKNGLKVFMTVNKEEPRIQTLIAVRVGGKDDPSETTGLAHYLEHLMFKGTPEYGTQDYEAEKPYLDEIEAMYEEYRTITDPAARKAFYAKIDSVSQIASQIAIPNEYDKMMSMIGARGTNAWTSNDQTVYTEDIPSNQIENWAKVQAGRFKNMVIRGFHTELEAVYEEYNRGLTSDGNKLFEALMASLFPHHPYGTQTVIGTQEHLKNPSITNIKRQYDTYYRPNNVAICVSGDFDPDEFVKIIEKYFGDWEPNPDLPEFKCEPEAPITAPVVKEVYGLESEMFALGWRLPGASDVKTTAVADIASQLLFNGQAGLFDLNINQQQKALFVQAGTQTLADYSFILAMGMPKQGQTSEEVRDLCLAEVAKLAAGDFDDALLPAIVNNIKLRKMRQLESNRARANAFVTAFTNRVEWKDACKDIERYDKVTKEDVIAFAKEYLGAENYAIVYKRQGVDTSEKKIEAPAITPIATNRDKRSAFLEGVQNSTVKPIEPVFADFSRDMSQFELAGGVNVLYKKNKLNDIATVQFVYNLGSEDDPALDVAADYISYLGTPTRTAEQIAVQMHALACNFYVRSSGNTTTLGVSGLSENIPQAVEILEDLIYNAQADENVLAGLKSDLFKSRRDAKSSQRPCFSALEDYVYYGPDYIKKTTLSDAQLAALTSEELLGKIRDLAAKGHEILYYGPESESKIKATLAACHKVSDNPEPLEEHFTPHQPTDKNTVVLANYDSKQFNYTQYTNLGGGFNPEASAGIALYNEYFGGSMNGIVFQEMRESKALAYSAHATLSEPSYKDGDYTFSAFIGSQNDKLRAAVQGFDSIINDLPASEGAFSVAKDAVLSKMRTRRYTGMQVLNLYRSCRRLGLSEPTDRQVFESIQAMTFDDLLATQQKWVKDRTYTYFLLGDLKDVDVNYLRSLGPVKTVTLEEIFGY